MPLLQKITDDRKTAMKSGDKPRLETLRFALAGLNAAQKEKEMKEPGTKLTDEEVIVVLQKDVKRRRESVELFKQGNRADLVEKEEGDIAILAEYLPKELSRQEIAQMVDGLKVQGFNDFTSLIRETMKLVKGRADGKMVGEVIKEKTDVERS
jgi:uncharacterized protein YqeY